MGYVIGVDIGTSSTKAVLFDTRGVQITRCAEQYPLRSPVPGAAEQSADEILAATLQTVTQVVAASGIDTRLLLGVSFSAAMHTLLLIDAENQPITPMFTWADSRSDRWSEAVQAQDTQTKHGADSLYQRTSIPPHPMSPVVKLAWLREERPALFAQAARVVSIKEYVLWHWCGEWVIDYSIASTTGLLNLSRLNWDEGAVELAGIRHAQLSQLVPTTHQLPLRAICAQKMGIPAGTAIVVGASDGPLANLGVGAITPEMAAITLGTSGAIRRAVHQPMTDRATQLFCYALATDWWVMGGAVNNGGIALQWTRDCLVPYSTAVEPPLSSSEPSASTYERMTQMAAAIAPGAEGLIFHPYLLGERAPLWDAQARASFFGLSRRHSQAHLVRAVMEGVLYNMQTVFEALVRTGGEVERLRASGGFAHSALWQQMLADIMNRPVEIPTVIESSAFGAAVLALVALGEWSHIEEVTERVEIAQVRTPIAKNVSRYQKLLPIYADLLSAFRNQYAALQQALRD